MSETTRALILATLIGLVILLGPIGLLAAGVVGPGAMLAIQAGVLLALYLVAVAIKNRRDAE
ncbi:MAG TPA: hypothetical protein VKA36_02870 [Solirubrobacterales bacterium]|nr:hypothetical protein [Solirubrobacterales bacterium]